MKTLTTAPLVLILALPACATVIDFEAEAARAGGSLTGIPNSPLTIGAATVTGGELLRAEINLGVDQTGVYATEGLFGADANPLVIRFAVPVYALSIFIANGDAANQTYTVIDNLGDTVTSTRALSGSTSNAAKTFSLPGTGIRSVSIASANAEFRNFAIDNVAFTPTPEPASVTCVTWSSVDVAPGSKIRLQKSRRKTGG
jgi:hypothetical protein